MTDAIEVVPLLQVPLEISSEIENSAGTPEVTNSHNGNRQVVSSKKKLATKSQCKLRRKSCGRQSQKLQLKPPKSSNKKLISILKLHSHIPKPLALTSPSSTTSFATDDGLSVKRITGPKRLQTTNTNVACLVRQKSGLILAFRQRKSLTEMDLNHARRQVKYPRNDCAENNCKENKNMVILHSQSSFMQNIYNQEHYLKVSERDPQMAVMRIFSSIMLNAWRKRRDQVKRLIEENGVIKRNAIKSKNQLHVFSSLFRIEQKRNEELKLQLRKSLDNVNRTKASSDNLATTMISLNADKILLEQQIHLKTHELESVSTILVQTKTELFKSMTSQRELQAALSLEQRKVQSIENKKNELIAEFCELSNDVLFKENELRKQLQEKCSEILKLKQQLIASEGQIKTLNQSTEELLSERNIREKRIMQEVESLKSQLDIMRKCLENKLDNRLKNCWNTSLAYQKTILRMLHLLAYYVLPATPTPKIKNMAFSFSLDKALSIVKR